MSVSVKSNSNGTAGSIQVNGSDVIIFDSTGNLTATSLTSTVATGTAPFTVSSTTVVTNLNADLLDGKNIGTSGNSIPLLDSNNTWSATQTVNGTVAATGFSTFYGSDSSNSAIISAYLDATTAYLASSKNGTGSYLPLAFYTGGSERVRIGTSGEIGIGGTNYGTSGQVLVSGGSGAAPSWTTMSSGATLSDDTATNASYYPTFVTTTTGAMTTAKVSSTKLYFNPSTGTLNATIFNSLSDLNQKDNIATIDNSVEIINQLRGVEFTWKDSGKKSSGVIAQELETVLSHLVDVNSEGLRSVNYSGLIGYLIEAVKELSARIVELESK